MNKFEYLLENNPFRGYVREKVEVGRLRAMTDVGSIGHALHIACGNGEATQVILKHFSSARMTGVDRDGSVIADAREKYPDAMFDFSVQDVTSLSFDDCQFDAVFDLADLHNYPNWKGGLAEVNRVLRPGGLFIMEELSLESFTFGAGKLFRALTDHPYDAMLTMEDFRDQALASGFEILRFEERIPFGLLKYFTMVARKA